MKAKNLVKSILKSRYITSDVKDALKEILWEIADCMSEDETEELAEYADEIGYEETVGSVL